VDPPLAAVALRAPSGLVLVGGETISACLDDGTDLRTLASVPMRPDERWNDAKVDPAGRLLAGTLTETYPDGVHKVFPPGASRLLRLDPDGSVTPVLDVTLSNGLGWSQDGRTFFYVDTTTGGLDAFDYAPDSGGVSGRRTLAAIAPQDGLPDGLAVDVEGGIWLALWGGSCVRRYLPDGSFDAVIELPVSLVTSCAFVGPDLDRLFITSARDELTPEQRAAQPHAGSVFIADPGVRGVEVARFAG
jgi:sugar lactone lactonase YvrE